MLVLSRRANEKVNIYDPSGTLIGSVMLAELRDNKARIGFDFAETYTIARDEVDRRKHPSLADIVRRVKEGKESAP